MDKPTKTDKDNIINIVYQDLNHLEKVVSNMNSHLMRIHRTVKLDEKEEITQNRRSETMLFQAIENNTEITTEYLRRLEEQKENPLGMEYYYAQQRDRSKEVVNNTKRIDYLRELRQKITPVCPCGKHKGIQFIDSDNNIVEERCPRSWWVSLSRQAFIEGRLGEFQVTTPYGKYVNKYSL